MRYVGDGVLDIPQMRLSMYVLVSRIACRGWRPRHPTNAAFYVCIGEEISASREVNMTEVKFKLPGADTITISGQTVDKLLRTGDGDAALLYLYILKTQGQSTTDETKAALGKDSGWIASAMAVLSRIKLIQLDDESGQTSDISLDKYPENPEETTRRLSTTDMKRELEAGSEFSIVAQETQRSFGRPLSPDELMRLFGIYDSLNMPPEVILHLITYCISESKRTGGGRSSSLMRYVEKAAYTWAREGIMSLEKAEDYLKNLEAQRSTRGEIKAAMQIKDREFSATERRYVDGWVAMGFCADAIEIAYDRTIVKTGQLTWNYMDTIIKSWHKKNLHTAKEIQEKDIKQRHAKNPKHETFDAPDQNEIKRMQNLLEKTKKS